MKRQLPRLQWLPAVSLKTSVSVPPLPPSMPPIQNQTTSVTRSLERAATNSVSPVTVSSPQLARSIMRLQPATTWRSPSVMATAAAPKTSPLPWPISRYQVFRPRWLQVNSVSPAHQEQPLRRWPQSVTPTVKPLLTLYRAPAVINLP